MSLAWTHAVEAQSESFVRDCGSFISAKGYSTDYIELVTEYFGKLAPSRWVGLDTIGQVWRPSPP